MNAKRTGKVGVIDLLLLLGCLAVIEMTVVILFWDDIALNDKLAFLRPRQPLEKLSILALIGGLIGLFNYGFSMFTEAVRDFRLRKYLASVFLASLLVLGFFYVIY